MTNNFNEKMGIMLKKVRKKLGFTLEDVSKKMEFENYQTLSSIEEGTRAIKANELAKIAKIYARDISYFLYQEEEMESETVLWRHCLDNNKAKIKEQEFLKYCYNYYEIENKLGINSNSKLQPLQLKPENIDFTIVREIANKYYNEMQLGARPACCLEKILEEKYNIKILFLDLECYGSAATASGKFGTAILINALEPVWRRNYDLAHELFHIITWNVFKHKDLHISDNLKEKPLIEKYADAFAANLLLPQEELYYEFNKKVEDNKISLLDLVSLAKEFLISTEALLWRLVNLKILKDSNVKELLDNTKFRSLDKAERKYDWKDAPDISIKYLTLAFKAYQKGLISRGKLAEYIRVNIADVSSKLKEYGFNEGDIYSEMLTTS